jgi:hypothetical protein
MLRREIIWSYILSPFVLSVDIDSKVTAFIVTEKCNLYLNGCETQSSQDLPQEVRELLKIANSTVRYRISSEVPVSILGSEAGGRRCLYP